MDTHRIEAVIVEEITQAVEGRLHDLRSTVKGAFRTLLWKGYETGKVPEDALYKMDALIDAVFNTTHRAGPEHETWPAYDKKKVDPLVAELKKVLGLP